MSEADEAVVLNWESRYERMLSRLQRLWNLFFKPSKAMQDIVAAPSFRGVLIIMIVEGVLWVLSTVEMFLKLEFVGGYAGEMGSLATFLAAAVLFFPMPVALGVKWAAKSVLVKYGLASGGDWDFTTAASVTGYAYIADVVMMVSSLVGAWFLFPSRAIEVWNQGTAMGIISGWQNGTRRLRLTTLLPVTIFCLLWKGYLGGLGAHFGTDKHCSILKGTVVFTLLGVLSFLLGFSTV
jgi:hypothetical protein